MKYQKDYIYIKKMLTSISKVHEKFAFQEIRKKPTHIVIKSYTLLTFYGLFIFFWVTRF